MTEDSSFLSKEKNGLRKRMLALRRALSSDVRPYLVESLFWNLVSLPEYKKAHCIMAYLAMPDEANLDLFLYYSLKQGKEVCIPVCVGDGLMVAGKLRNMENFEKGPFGLRNLPTDYEVVLTNRIDMVLIPAVAYDTEGYRLGMGKGYYDRFLEEISYERRIGVAWNFQVVPMVPTEKHDKRVCKIVTEERIITVKGMKA